MTRATLLTLAFLALLLSSDPARAANLRRVESVGAAPIQPGSRRQPPRDLAVRAAVARGVEQTTRSAFERVAEQLAIPLRVIDASRGAPAEVLITPLLVYQDHRGRSFFEGRYVNIEKVRLFVRTARHVPQTSAAPERAI